MNSRYTAYCLLLIVIILTIFLVNKHISNLNPELKVIDFAANDFRDDYCDQRVIVIGNSLRAKEGAIVDGEHGFVIIKGLDEWPEILGEKKVSCSGRLSKVVWPDRGPMVAAAKGTQFYIEIESITIMK
jgi:hypothetical protein